MDLPLGRIGKFLSLPVGTVKWRLHCARIELARRLGAQRPVVRLVLLALLLAAGLAAGRGLYTLGTAVLETHAERAGFESHAENAESAESVSHAEDAESVSHAEFAESAESVSHAENAESAEPIPSTPSTPSTLSTVPTVPTVSTPESSEMNAKSLLPATRSRSPALRRPCPRISTTSAHGCPASPRTSPSGRTPRSRCSS